MKTSTKTSGYQHDYIWLPSDDYLHFLHVPLDRAVFIRVMEGLSSVSFAIYGFNEPGRGVTRYLPVGERLKGVVIRLSVERRYPLRQYLHNGKYDKRAI